MGASAVFAGDWGVSGMRNGFRRGFSPNRLLAGHLPRLEAMVRDRREQRKAALRRSSILSSRLTVEALEPRLLLSADVAPVPDGGIVPIDAGIAGVATDQPEVAVEQEWDGDTDAPPSPAAVATQVGEYAIDIEGQESVTGFYAFGPTVFADGPAATGADAGANDGADIIEPENGAPPPMMLSGDMPVFDMMSSMSTEPAAIFVPPVSRALNVPGATETFTFTLTEPRKLYFDSLTDRTDIHWTLTGPAGKIVDARFFGQSDSLDIAGSNVLDLAAGDYRLVVDGVGDAIGAYAFRLLDISNATHIDVGALVTGGNEGRLTDFYSFDAVAGERYFLDRRGLGGGNATWRLIGPDGEYVRGPESFDDSGIFTLARTGVYTLAIEGRDSNSAPIDYSFNLSRVTDTEQALTIGETVRGRVDGPGNSVTYAFDLAADTNLLFDSLLLTGNLHWTLVGPRGTEVNSRFFSSSDGYNGPPQLRLAAGAYRLTVAGNGDSIGDFAFGLLDPAAAADVTGLAEFGGAVGDGGASDSMPHGGGAPIDYSAMPGAQNRGWDVNRFGELTVPDSPALRGDALTLEAWISADNPLDDGAYQGILFKGSSTSWNDGYGLVRVGGAIRFYVNDWSSLFVEAALPADRQWTHVAATYDGAVLRLYLDGELAAEQAYAGAIVHSLAPLAIGAAPQGDYRWNGVIDEARVWNVARSASDIAASASTPLTGDETGLVGYWRFDEATGRVAADSSPSGVAATGTASATQTQLYRFTASRGESWYFDILSQSDFGGALSVRVYRPDGIQMTGPQSLYGLSLSDLPMDGDYVIAVEGSIYNGSGASFAARVVKVADALRPIVPGAPVTGEYDVAERTGFTFTLTQPTRLLFDSLAANFDLHWTLTGPRGVEVNQRTFAYSDSFDLAPSLSSLLDLPAGDYTLTIGAHNPDGNSAFAFRLLELAAGTAVALDSDIADRFDTAGGTRLFHFTGNAGDQLAIERLAGDYVNFYNVGWRLFDPFGRPLGSIRYLENSEAVTLTATGTYTLAIEPNGQSPSFDYAFRINQIGTVPLPDTADGTAFAIGDTVNGTLDTEGEADLYRFTLTAPQRLYFDSLTSDTSKYWSLFGPQGFEVTSRALGRSDGTDFGGHVVLDLPAGDYQLRIDGSTGAYGWRLIDVASATPLSPGSAVVAGLLEPARASAIYAFTGAAGEKLYFDARTTLGSGGTIRIVDPFGRTLLNPVTFADREVTLTAGGTYLLFVEGRATNSAANDDYSFVLNRPRDPAPLDLAMGQRVEGELLGAGDVQRYRFTLSDTRLLAFDSFTNNSNLTWRLSGPGFDYSATLRASDSYDQSGGRPPLLLSPGEYELLIDGALANIGPYAFRLLDLAASATPIAGTGESVAGTLTPATETHAYALDLAVGEAFVFDARQAPGSGSLRIVDGNGRELTTAVSFVDRTFTAPQAGRYYILIEGRVTDTAASRPYEFAVIRTADPQPVAMQLGETVSTAIARPTEVNRFTFTLTESTRVYFDSLTGDTGLSWTLSGAVGPIATNSFYFSDSGEATSDRVITLAPGTYEIAVKGDNFRTGPASFRLLDLGTAGDLPLGQPVSGTLAPANETDMFRFEAVAGDRFYFQNLIGVANANFRIIAPNGQQTQTPAGLGDREFTADQTGTYVILIEGRSWDTAASRAYRFALHRGGDVLTGIDIDGNLAQPVLTRPGVIGNALSMTTHEQIQVADPALDLRGDLTVEFWLNPDRMTDSWTPLVYKDGDIAGQRGYSIWYNSSGYIHLSTMRGTANDTLETASGSVPLGQWTHVTAVIERSTGQMRLYLNGVLATSRTISTAAHNGSADKPLHIGAGPERNDAYHKLEGGLDELRIWDHGRSAADILADMLSGAPANDDGLVLHMDFDTVIDGRVVERVSGANVPVLRDLAGISGVIEGRLDTPGDTRSYSFTLTEPRMVAFDALHDNSAMTVTLTGPGGINHVRNMRNGESQQITTSAMLLQPGSYTITVDGSGTATGAFAFRFIDLDSAPLLDRNAAVTGRTSGSADNQAWRIDVTAGDRLFIDLQQFTEASNRASFRLLDPFGREVYGPLDVGDFDTGPLAFTGSYTLIMETRAWLSNWPIDYRLAVYTVPDGAAVPIQLDGPNPQPPAVIDGVTGNALALRGVDYVEIADGAAVDVTRSVTAEGWFRFDRATNSWMPVFSKGTNATSPYRLAVNGNGSVWGAVRDASGLESVQSAAGAVPFGEWVHLAMVADRDAGTLVLYVNGIAQATRAIRANDNVNSDDPLYIGHYTQADGSYGPVEGAVDSVRLWNTARGAADILAGMAAPPPAGTAGLNLAFDFESTSLPAGATLRSVNPNGVTGRIATPGAENRYSFTLTQDTLALFDSLTSNGGLRWQLAGPQGLVVDWRRFDQSDSSAFSGNPVLKLGAGAYVLTVDGTGDVTGDYNFRLTDLAGAAPLPMGSAVTAALTPANATRAYRFAANAGESVFFDALSTENDVRWRLVDPFGNLVFNQTTLTDINGQRLAFTGTYTLLIEGVVSQGTVAGYSFAVHPMTVQDAMLTIGDRVDSTISRPGEIDRYSFTLADRTRLLFDSFTHASAINWTLSGPGGTVVTNRRFDQSDGLGLSANPVLDLSAGSWTLTIDGTGDASAAYGFRLLEIGEAEALAPSGTYSRALGEQGRETDMYRFDAVVGMRFGFDLLSGGGGNARWRLIDPLGQVVFGPSVPANTGLMTAALAGTYTLLVEGYTAQGTDVGYSFRFDVPAQPPANGETGQDFDGAGLPYALVNHNGAAAQVLNAGGNDFLRLTDALNANPHNSVFFSATGAGRQDNVDVAFDFRVEPRAGQATNPDGIAFAWLPVTTYGAGGPGPMIPRSASTGLEPNVAGALGIGFDSFANSGEVNANHVSIHYNGVKLADIANPGLTIASGDWTRARVLMTRTDGGTLLTVQLTAEGGATVTVVSDYFIPGMELEAGRVAISASQGTSTGDQDIDNLSVAMTAAAQPIVRRNGERCDRPRRRGEPLCLHHHRTDRGRVRFADQQQPDALADQRADADGGRAVLHRVGFMGIRRQSGDDAATRHLSDRDFGQWRVDGQLRVPPARSGGGERADAGRTAKCHARPRQCDPIVRVRRGRGAKALFRPSGRRDRALLAPDRPAGQYGVRPGIFGHRRGRAAVAADRALHADDRRTRGGNRAADADLPGRADDRPGCGADPGRRDAGHHRAARRPHALQLHPGSEHDAAVRQPDQQQPVQLDADGSVGRCRRAQFQQQRRLSTGRRDALFRGGGRLCPDHRRRGAGHRRFRVRAGRRRRRDPDGAGHGHQRHAGAGERHAPV
ncbi:MAG: hypothetical protein DI569_03340 [Sphingopyxis macrogoltabida]|uniref:LamG-like jellyroll fold domain-containing protein n=1 Tax=Sphingopyxis macrogoltabida TaxID=33050 RepID=A0A2W5N176_SPHMC|nr:MAG: hypothetical protein DI569_03340 [Sphingopyxis macrogoltabida]